MKLLNIKKISFASALVAGSIFSLGSMAQTTTIYSGSPGNALSIVGPGNALSLVSGLNLTCLLYTSDAADE